MTLSQKRQRATVKTAEDEFAQLELVEGELLLAEDIDSDKDTTKELNIDASPVELGLQAKSPEVFKKSHELIFSRQKLTAHEQNIFNLMIAHMRSEHWDNPIGPTYEFPAQLLSEWFGIESNYLSSTLSPVADRLAKRTVGFANEKGDWDYIPIISRISYKNGRLTIIPNSHLKEQYIDYSRSGYALINRKPLYKLKKTYSKRLYEILSRFKQERKGYKQHPLSITQIQGYFGLFDEKGNLNKESKSLGTTSVFIKRCIEEPLKEIADTCGHELIFFEHEGRLGFSLIKNGKKTVGLKFHYRWIDQTVDMSEETAKSTIKELETRRLLKKERLGNEDLKFLAEAYLTLGEKATAKEIYSVIEKREEEAESKADNTMTKEEKEKLDFFEKIKQMKESCKDVSY